MCHGSGASGEGESAATQLTPVLVGGEPCIRFTQRRLFIKTRKRMRNMHWTMRLRGLNHAQMYFLGTKITWVQKLYWSLVSIQISSYFTSIFYRIFSAKTGLCNPKSEYEQSVTLPNLASPSVKSSVRSEQEGCFHKQCPHVVCMLQKKKHWLNRTIFCGY